MKNKDQSLHFQETTGTTRLLVIGIIAWTTFMLVSRFSVIRHLDQLETEFATLAALEQVEKEIQLLECRTTAGNDLAENESRKFHKAVADENEINIQLLTISGDELNSKDSSWRFEAIGKIVEGAPYYSKVEHTDENRSLKILHPVRAETSCVECHFHSTAAIDELLGVIEVTLSTQPYANVLQENSPLVLIKDMLFWLLGVGALLWSNSLITGRKKDLSRHQQAIHAEYQRFHAVMNSMDAVVYVADMDTFEMLFQNQRAKDLVGDGQNKKCWEVIQTGQTGPCSFCTNSKLLNDKGQPTGPYVWEFQNTKTNSWFQCRDEAIPWPDGRLVRLEIAIDITELKNAEKELLKAKETAEKAKQAREDFMAVMSHEIRTPLNPILGFADLMLSDHQKEPEKTYLETIIRSAKHQLNLVNNLLNYSRLQRNTREPRYTEFDITKLCRNAISDIKHVAEDLQIGMLNGEKHDNVPLGTKVQGEQDMLIQLIDNLLNNACKYTEKGGVTLHLGVERGANEKDSYFIEIEDTGIGIPDHIKETLFDPFVQADKSFTQDYQGAGLGLAICKEITNLLGGEIGVFSQEGVGSTFWVKIPMQTLHTPSSGAPIQDRRNDNLLLSKRNMILIVEDKPENAFITQTFLKRMGAVVEIVENGIEATQKCIDKQFDLILMDLSLPNKNGFEATEDIRAHCPKNSNTPIVALTANVSPGINTRCLNAGMNAYLSKPIDRVRLFETIENLTSIKNPA